MKKVVTICGTRPEWTKLSALIPMLDSEFNHILVHTGQHYSYNMDKIFFEELQLRPPNYCLEVGSGTQAEQVGKGMIEFEKILIKEKPDIVITFADTNAPITGALTAAKLHIPIVHIEAGARSFNRIMPEEINRILTDHCSDLLFPADEAARKNLINENIPENKIFLVGRTVYEACLRTRELAKHYNTIKKYFLEKENYALLTLHRSENTNDLDILRGLINAINDISNYIKIVFPIHPRTEKILRENKIELSKKIQVIEPQGYIDFTNLLINSNFAMSDSGTIQEEAVIYNVPCVILRNETEWTEFVEKGKNILATTNPEKIISVVKELLSNPEKIKQIKSIVIKQEENTCRKIIEIIKNELLE